MAENESTTSCSYTYPSSVHGWRATACAGGPLAEKSHDSSSHIMYWRYKAEQGPSHLEPLPLRQLKNPAGRTPNLLS